MTDRNLMQTISLKTTIIITTGTTGCGAG
ncbi:MULTISPECIES: thr operon leader peptide [Photorhabdus]